MKFKQIQTKKLEAALYVLQDELMNKLVVKLKFNSVSDASEILKAIRKSDGFKKVASFQGPNFYVKQRLITLLLAHLTDADYMNCDPDCIITLSESDITSLLDVFKKSF